MRRTAGPPFVIGESTRRVGPRIRRERVHVNGLVVFKKLRAIRKDTHEVKIVAEGCAKGIIDFDDLFAIGMLMKNWPIDFSIYVCCELALWVL